MRIELFPTEYVIYRAVVDGLARSYKTWKADAYALLSFVRFMDEHGFDWRHPIRAQFDDQLGHYRTYLEHKSLVRGYIAKLLNKICRFYEWAFHKGYIEQIPFTRIATPTRKRGFLAHLSHAKSSERPLVVPRVPSRRRYPRYYNRDEQELIYNFLSARDRLIMEWALYTGAREFELCELQIQQIPAQSEYRSKSVYQLKVVGKGGITTELSVPTWLLDRTHQYIKFFARSGITREATARGVPKQTALFLGRWGRPIKPDSVYRAFRKALKAAKIKGRFHDLRHTYAISTLHKLMQLNRHRETAGLNAILELKYLLRHASLSSTQIYLEARNYYLTEIYSDLFELPERFRNG